MRSLVPSGRYAAMYLRGTSVYGPRYRAVLSFPAGVPDTVYTAVILHSPAAVTVHCGGNLYPVYIKEPGYLLSVLVVVVTGQNQV